MKYRVANFRINTTHDSGGGATQILREAHGTIVTCGPGYLLSCEIDSIHEETSFVGRLFVQIGR